MLVVIPESLPEQEHLFTPEILLVTTPAIILDGWSMIETLPLRELELQISIEPELQLIQETFLESILVTIPEIL